MTKIVRMKIVLEDRDTQTLISEDIFDSHYPMYIDDNKLFQIRPIGGTLRGFEIDVDTLNDIDGPKVIGDPVSFSTIIGDNIANLQTNGFKTDTRFAAPNNITVDYPTETGKIALERFTTYSALISQSGGSAPTVTILRNTIGDIVWSRAGAGNYLATLSGAFDVTKLQIFIGGNTGSIQTFYGSGFNDANSIFLSSIDFNAGAFTPTDGLITDLPIEIRIYP